MQLKVSINLTKFRITLFIALIDFVIVHAVVDMCGICCCLLSDPVQLTMSLLVSTGKYNEITQLEISVCLLSQVGTLCAA